MSHNYHAAMCPLQLVKLPDEKSELRHQPDIFRNIIEGVFDAIIRVSTADPEVMKKAPYFIEL